MREQVKAPSPKPRFNRGKTKPDEVIHRRLVPRRKSNVAPMVCACGAVFVETLLKHRHEQQCPHARAAQTLQRDKEKAT